MRHRLLVPGLLLILAGSACGSALAQEASDEGWPFSRGFGYLGAFFVTGTSTEVRVFSSRLPLGTRLNVEEDLGVRNSFTVPRLTLGWRFGQRHVLSGSYYDLTRDGVRRIERTIELPDGDEFEVGVEVASRLKFRLGKILYTYLFHRDRKVTLGIGGGLFVAALGADLSLSARAGENEEDAPALDESVTAPLPVVGFRLTYRLTRKWGLLATSDWFLLNYNDRYKGILSDTQVIATHRTFKHVGFAAGLNVQTVSVEVEDGGLIWQADSRMAGVLAAVTFYL